MNSTVVTNRIRNGDAGIHFKNCPARLERLLRQYAIVLLGALIAVASLEIFCMVCSPDVMLLPEA